MAASPGQTASANPKGMNSLYTQELVQRLATPGLRLEDVFIETRNAVVAASGGKQVPQEFGTLTTRVYLAGSESSTSPTIATSSEEATAKVSPTEILLEFVGVPATAKITVDGSVIKGTVFRDDIAENEKEVSVAITADGYKPFLGKVSLRRGAIRGLKVNLERKASEPFDVRINMISTRLNAYPALKAYIENMKPIPGGTFLMGGESILKDAKPIHKVRLSSYLLGSTPVTVNMWKEYCASTGVRLPSSPAWGLLDDHPIVHVSWVDIMGWDGKGGYCEWVNSLIDSRFILPTEAQHEFAMRGGHDGMNFSWGNYFATTKLWCSSSKLADAGQTASVFRSNKKYVNEFGLSDLTGNVWELLSDWYSPYNIGQLTDPNGPANGSLRCMRGGSWMDFNADYFVNSFRNSLGQMDKNSNVGFRLSCSSL